MDAKLPATVLWLCVITVGGCTLPPVGLTPQRARPLERPEPRETPIVVQNPEATAGTDDEPIDESVRKYVEQIQRVDDIGRLARRNFPPVDSPPRTAGRRAIRRAADAEYVTPRQDNPPANAREFPDETAIAAPNSPNGVARDAERELEPPQLTAIHVQAAPESEPIATPVPAERIGASADVNRPLAAQPTISTLQEFVDRLGQTGGDAGFRAQLDQRILQALVGNVDRARRPLELVSRAQQDLAAGIVDTLIAIREAGGGAPRLEAQRVLEQIDVWRRSLTPAVDLRIDAVRLCRAVRGFGQYDVLDPPHFRTGQTNEFVIYCEVSNFVSEQRPDNRFETLFDFTTTIMTRTGDTVLELKDTDVRDVCRNRRRDCFIPRLVRLPATLSPGEYVARVTIVDKLGKKVAQERATFRVVAGS